MTTPTPPVWFTAPGNPLITKAQVGLGVSNPTVIKAAGRLASPIDAWYMWFAPHDEPGGMYLATAATPAGPWTIRNGSLPVIAREVVAGCNHVASPYVLWNPNTSKLMMWGHAGGFAGGEQRSYLWTSTDGVAWTLENGGAPVLTKGTAGQPDEKYAAYLVVVHDGAQFVGYYQGADLNADEVTTVLTATSPDGITWTKAGPAFANLHVRASYNPAVLRLGQADFIYYMGGYGQGAGGVWRSWLRKRGAALTPDTSPRHSGITATGWCAGRIIPNDFVYDNGRLWMFHGGSTTPGSTAADDQLGAHYADYALNFDTSWGKG